MKFTFTKHKLKIMIIDLIIVIVFFGIFYFYTLQDLFTGYLFLSLGIVMLFKMLHYYYLMIKFLKHHSKEEIKQFEVELSDVLLKYKNCFLTQKYIFDLETFTYIKYDDIICITLDSMTTISSNEGFTIGKKQIIYLKNNKKYIIKTSLSRSSHEFVKLIKKKNNDIFIGDINEYKIQKEKIEYIKQIKERTRI